MKDIVTSILTDESARDNTAVENRAFATSNGNSVV